MSFADYAARGKTDWWRYGVAAVLAFGLAMAMVVVLTVALSALGLHPEILALGLLRPSDPVVFFLGNGVIFGLFLAGFIIALRLVMGKSARDVVGAWQWRGFGLGLGLWSAVLIAGSLIDRLAAPHGFSPSASAQTPALAACALVGLAAQTFAEEFVFRGFVTQGLLLATRRPLAAALLSGLIFGACHIPNGAPQAANAVVFGTVLSLIAIRTGGLALGFGAHLVNNVYGAVIVVSADDVFRGSPGFFTQHTPGLLWFDTGFAALALVLLALIARGRTGAKLNTPLTRA